MTTGTANEDIIKETSGDSWVDLFVTFLSNKFTHRGPSVGSHGDGVGALYLIVIVNHVISLMQSAPWTPDQREELVRRLPKLIEQSAGVADDRLQELLVSLTHSDSDTEGEEASQPAL